MICFRPRLTREDEWRISVRKHRCTCAHNANNFRNRRQYRNNDYLLDKSSRNAERPASLVVADLDCSGVGIASCEMQPGARFILRLLHATVEASLFFPSVLIGLRSALSSTSSALSMVFVCEMSDFTQFLTVSVKYATIILLQHLRSSSAHQTFSRCT
jgi:hypothetical protein